MYRRLRTVAGHLTTLTSSTLGRRRSNDPRCESLENRVLLAAVFVAVDGNDATGDGSVIAPYQTLQQAVDVADPGDVITLRGGTYAGGVTIYDPDITIRSHDGEWAVIQSPIDNSSVPQTIRFHIDANNGRLQDLEIVGGYYYAVKTESNWDWGVPDHERRGTSGLIIEDSKLHGSGRDVIKLTPGSDDVIIRRNAIYNSGLRDSGNAEGIDNVNADRMIVQDNYIHDIATNAVYFKGGSIGSIVERNFIENTGSGGVMMGFYTDIEWFDTTVNPDYYESIDGIVRNNIIRNTAWAGIGFYASLNPLAYNNTLIHVAQQAQAGLLASVVEHYTSSTTFSTEANVNPQAYNNIVVLSAQSSRRVVDLREGSVIGPIEFGDNLYFDEGGPAVFASRLVDPSHHSLSLAQWQAEVGDAGSLEADPRLDANFHLAPISSARNAGRLVSGLTYDYDGNPRTDGMVDIGADEYGAGPSLTAPPPAGTIGTGIGVLGAPPVDPADIFGRAGNGRLIAAVSNGSSFSTSIAGGINPALPWSHDLDAGDFNGDGLTDLVGFDASSGRLKQLLMQPDGMFVAVTSAGVYGSAGGRTWGQMQVGDFNGDGTDDVALRSPEDGIWGVTLGTTAQGLGATSAVWGAWSPFVQWHDLHAADINGDGRADLIGRAETGTWVGGFSVDGESRFATKVIGGWSTAVAWSDARIGDFNGDGRHDVIGRAETGTIVVGLSQGESLQMSAFGGLPNAGQFGHFAVGDFNADGKDDLFSVSASGKIVIGVSDGSRLTNRLFASVSTIAGFNEYLIADFDGNGMDDFATRSSGGTWIVGLSDGDTFTTSIFGQWTTAETFDNVKTRQFVIV